MKQSIGFAALAAALLTVASPRPLLADDADAQFKSHVTQAKVHYDLGEFDEAAAEYLQAYQVKPVPGALFNIAQAYRQAGKFEKSRDYYNKFLHDANPDSKTRAAVAQQLRELNDLIAKEDSGLEPPGAAPAPQVASAAKPAPAKSNPVVNSAADDLSPPPAPGATAAKPASAKPALAPAASAKKANPAVANSASDDLSPPPAPAASPAAPPAPSATAARPASAKPAPAPAASAKKGNPAVANSASDDLSPPPAPAAAPAAAPSAAKPIASKPTPAKSNPAVANSASDDLSPPPAPAASPPAAKPIAAAPAKPVPAPTVVAKNSPAVVARNNPPAASRPVPAPQASVRAGAPAPRSHVAAYVVGGAALAVIGTGIFFGIQASRADNELTAGPHDRADGDTLISTSKRDHTVADVLFGVGAAAAVGAGLLYFWPASGPSGGGGGAVGGHF